MLFPNVDVDSIPVSPQLRTIAKRLVEWEDPDPEVHIANRPEYVPNNRLAAVLILLFERDGVVRVLLTTRSKALRSHPGQTALPGGKSDLEDGTPFVTALREANEEVSLPLNNTSIHVLRTMPPFPSIYKLLVTPVVAILSDPSSVLPTLKPNPDEVDTIFDHPLEANPEMMRSVSGLAEPGTEQWPYTEDLWNFSDSPFHEGSYRNNRLRSTATAIKGLTCSLMLQVAQIAYARRPSYEAYAPDAVPISSVISRLVAEHRDVSSSPSEQSGKRGVLDMGQGTDDGILAKVKSAVFGGEPQSGEKKGGEGRKKVGGTLDMGQDADEVLMLGANNKHDTDGNGDGDGEGKRAMSVSVTPVRAGTPAPAPVNEHAG